MEKAWLPSLLGEVELEERGWGWGHVSEGAAELEALPDSDSSILEARDLWVSFNTPRAFGASSIKQGFCEDYINYIKMLLKLLYKCEGFYCIGMSHFSPSEKLDLNSWCLPSEHELIGNRPVLCE